MKQGIVVEVKNRKAIVLTREGAFERVSLKKGEQVEIGSEIEFAETKKIYHSRPIGMGLFIAVVAAVFFLFFPQILPSLNQVNMTVAAYISVDINPSLEVGVNDAMKVIELIPLNESGEKIAAQIGENYRNLTLSQFINQTIDIAEKGGFLKDNKDVLVTATMINKELKTSVEKNLTKIKQEIKEKKSVHVETLESDETARKEAKDLGVSTGKYILYKKAADKLTIEEAKELSITQLFDKIDKKELEDIKKKIMKRDYDKNIKKIEKAENELKKLEAKLKTIQDRNHMKEQKIEQIEKIRNRMNEQRVEIEKIRNQMKDNIHKDLKEKMNNQVLIINNKKIKEDEKKLEKINKLKMENEKKINKVEINNGQKVVQFYDYKKNPVASDKQYKQKLEILKKKMDKQMKKEEKKKDLKQSKIMDKSKVQKERKHYFSGN